jgi:hypothetical protein
VEDQQLVVIAHAHQVRPCDLLADESTETSRSRHRACEGAAARSARCGSAAATALLIVAPLHRTALRPQISDV